MCIGMIYLRIERQLLVGRRVLSCSAHHRAPELLERQGDVAVGVERINYSSFPELVAEHWSVVADDEVGPGWESQG